MAYTLNAVTVRTNNTADGMQKIDELWRDVASGKLPILFDSEHAFQRGISPVSMYANYASDETGDYDLSILGVTSDFFGQLEALVADGKYKKYDVGRDDGDIGLCAKEAWGAVWEAQKAGDIVRAFTKDYESTVPSEYTKDGKAHCYLYIAVKPTGR